MLSILIKVKQQGFLKRIIFVHQWKQLLPSSLSCSETELCVDATFYPKGFDNRYSYIKEFVLI